MPIKKSELYSSMWQSCDELRGGMDASQYKDYVLVLLFVKYVSDKAAARKGYLLDVPKGGGFADMIALKGDKEIGDRMNKVVGELAKANDLHLPDYWSEAMQDDVYLIAAAGWREAAKPRQIVEHKDKKSKEKPDFTVGRSKFKAELLPPALLIAREFAPEQAAIDALESEASAAAQAMDELAEEHGGEDGLLADAKNDKDKLTKASVSARLKEIKGDADAADERKLLSDYLALAEKESTLNAQASAAREALTAKVVARYGKLTEDEIPSVIIEDKWLAALGTSVQGELDRVSQRLAGRVRELAQRYATPLPALEREVADWSSRVEHHLARMGFRP